MRRVEHNIETLKRYLRFVEDESIREILDLMIDTMESISSEIKSIKGGQGNYE